MNSQKSANNSITRTVLFAFLGTFLAMSPSLSSAYEGEQDNTLGVRTKRTIQFTFSNIKKSGVLHYSVYCDKDTYSKAGDEGVVGTVEDNFTVPETNELVRPIEITTDQPYCSLLFYVDENGNGVLDRSRFLGLPKEGVGFSRVTSKPLSKPSWDATRFEMSTTQTMTAQVFYY